MGIRTAVNVLWSDAIVLVFEGVFHGGRSNMGLEMVNTETRPWAIVQSSYYTFKQGAIYPGKRLIEISTLRLQ